MDTVAAMEPGAEKPEALKGAQEDGKEHDVLGCTGMSRQLIAEAMRIGVEVGTKVAKEYLEEKKKEQVKGRYSRRLRNTRYLLANYRNLKAHVKSAVYNGHKANESAIDILDELDSYEYEGNYYIESIAQSQQRSLIILTHIEEMLNLWRIACEQSPRPEDLRRCRIIYAAYIDPEVKSADEISQEYGIEKSTYYKDIKKAMQPLSALIFGVDGLRLS